MTAYVNTFQRLAWQEAFPEAFQEGFELGTHIGATRIFHSLLLHRFGELPAWVGDKTAEASMDTIVDWSVHILDARSVDEVFA